MDVNEILRMIETVDPADSAKMDEIDARVEVYLLNDLKNYLFEGRVVSPQEFIAVCKDLGCNTPSYTRSRDALKAIRPDRFKALICTEPTNGVWDIEQDLGNEESGYWHYGLVSKAKSEELAELHAVLQAIDYERKLHE